MTASVSPPEHLELAAAAPEGIKKLRGLVLELAVCGKLGMFGKQNSVCRPATPSWRTTVERLKDLFPSYADR